MISLGLLHLNRVVGALCIALALGASHGAMAQKRPQVKFTTSLGDFVVELHNEAAPATVNHFLANVRDRVYDNTIFHKSIADFVVQGGGFDGSFNERPIKSKLAHEGQEAMARGGLPNKLGTIAMARGSEKNSAGNEFFINIANNPDLDPIPIPNEDPVKRFEYGGKIYANVPRGSLTSAPELYGYTAFGQVTSGMDVIDKIKRVPTGKKGPFPSDVPLTTITILKVEELRPGMASEVTVTTAPAVAVAKPAGTTAPVVSQDAQKAAVAAALTRWTQAWSSKDVPGYLSAYTPDYKAPTAKNRKDWEEQRRARISEKSNISLKLENTDIQVKGDSAVVKFRQVYKADAVSSTGNKTLTFIRQGDVWLISNEDSK